MITHSSKRMKRDGEPTFTGSDRSLIFAFCQLNEPSVNFLFSLVFFLVCRCMIRVILVMMTTKLKCTFVLLTKRGLSFLSIIRLSWTNDMRYDNRQYLTIFWSTFWMILYYFYLIDSPKDPEHRCRRKKRLRWWFLKSQLLLLKTDAFFRRRLTDLHRPE